VRRRDLLGAIADLKPVHIVGTFERHSSLRWEELKASAAGGRWGARRAYEVLYLGRPRDSVVIEAYRHLVDDELDDGDALAATVLERRIITCEVAVSNVLDLGQSAAQAAVGLSDSQLCSAVGDYEACQAGGAAAHQLGLAGIIAPAATGLGETLALFSTNLAVEQWPTVVARDIWRGLPVDPRRLRAVDEEIG
jgi:RES domain